MSTSSGCFFLALCFSSSSFSCSKCTLCKNESSKSSPFFI
jgi:hypothetical protein